MIEHYWTVLCRNGIIDRDSNNISLHEVLEQLNIVGKPPKEKEAGAMPGEHMIVSLWGRADYDISAKGTARYVIEFHSGKYRGRSDEMTISIDLTQHTRSRSRMTLNLLPIFGEGLHRINVSLKMDGDKVWRDVTSIPYEIRFKPSD